MKLSINFLKDYVDLDKDIDVVKLAEDMTNAGNEYDEAGKLINATKLVIAEVVECKEHPDSDHLHCCKVNTGKENDFRWLPQCCLYHTTHTSGSTGERNMMGTASPSLP